MKFFFITQIVFEFHFLHISIIFPPILCHSLLAYYVWTKPDNPKILSLRPVRKIRLLLPMHLLPQKEKAMRLARAALLRHIRQTYLLIVLRECGVVNRFGLRPDVLLQKVYSDLLLSISCLIRK